MCQSCLEPAAGPPAVEAAQFVTADGWPGRNIGALNGHKAIVHGLRRLQPRWNAQPHLASRRHDLSQYQSAKPDRKPLLRDQGAKYVVKTPAATGLHGPT